MKLFEVSVRLPSPACSCVLEGAVITRLHE